ncbi:DUF1800 family protein [Jannaschia sp. W003]|uniref:DUF1800 domain-containing protein n=1 Tax=Jannaschia sp. W003 TaxID=2867012 RepID=UPI0021A34364|nr:DUF1800 domain-containing protein [Jannaschia sp. W003]UWQ21350.1 DUF1800 domain-containing protein [Jannaschia sp. W003]
MDLRPTLAAVRFGTGLSPRLPAPRDAGAILARLAGPDLAMASYPHAPWHVVAAEAMEFVAVRRKRNDSAAADQAFRDMRDAMTERWWGDMARVVQRAVTTTDGFRERLDWFWSDHFTVSGMSGYLRRTIPAYRSDIRRHVAGRFADLLYAAVTHPAMLDYLDQRRSAGPNSPRGRRGGGLNENLARELLELHTLGADGGYGQADVTELAKLMTGFTVTKEGLPQFQPNMAEPGAETVLGRSYGGGDPSPEHFRAAVEDLAVHPATARHLARKLAVHFVADDPEPALVEALERTWLHTGGDLMAVYAALLDHPAAWAPELRKVRRPLEVIVAGMRALDPDADLTQRGRNDLRVAIWKPMQLMGQQIHETPGPDGWPEAAEAWITPQGLAARIEWAMTVPVRLADLPEPRGFVDTALGPLATGRTRFAAGAAETREAGIGLVLASPEFQRR